MSGLFNSGFLPARVLLELCLSSDLTQVDLGCRNRVVAVSIRNWLGVGEVRPSDFFLWKVVDIDCLLRDRHSITSQIEKALAFHCELEATLGANGGARVIHVPVE